MLFVYIYIEREMGGYIDTDAQNIHNNSYVVMLSCVHFVLVLSLGDATYFIQEYFIGTPEKHNTWQDSLSQHAKIALGIFL